MSVLTATAWPDNSYLIEDVAKLGYLDGDVIDVTYGEGVFWKRFTPSSFVACDINAAKSPIGYSVDFTDLPDVWTEEFDAVVLDPPYKLNGTSTDGTRYGTEDTVKWQDRHELVYKGIKECARILRPHGYLALKCMDQVCSGKKRFQTMDFTQCGMAWGLELADRFDLLRIPRQQPGERRQVHTLQNYSTLLILEKVR